MKVVKDGPLHENVEEERDLRVGPVWVPIPLVRPTLQVNRSISGNTTEEIKLSRLS
jgi:hypothetical protein